MGCGLQVVGCRTFWLSHNCSTTILIQTSPRFWLSQFSVLAIFQPLPAPSCTIQLPSYIFLSLPLPLSHNFEIISHFCYLSRPLSHVREPLHAEVDEKVDEKEEGAESEKREKQVIVFSQGLDSPSQIRRIRRIRWIRRIRRIQQIRRIRLIQQIRRICLIRRICRIRQICRIRRISRVSYGIRWIRRNRRSQRIRGIRRIRRIR